MIDYLLNTTDLRLLLPETLWLESEYFEQAKEIGNRLNSEQQQWQAYLNALALFSFEAWTQKQLPHEMIHRDISHVETGCYLRMGGFKVCVLATGQVLDETVDFPRSVVQSPELAAHFYTVLEVLEEQEQAIVRGFLQHDELMSHHNQAPLAPASDIYSLPLSALDSEINHLVSYLQHFTPDAIFLPQASMATSTAAIHPPAAVMDFQVIKIRLGQWLQGAFDQGWQALDALMNPEAALALGTRNFSSGIKGGKLINFEMQLGTQTVALVVTVAPEPEGKLRIGIQVLPVGGATVLPPQLRLSLLSKTEAVLQEVQSRAQDSYMQLKPFKGKPGTTFSVEVSLNGARVKEVFEL